MHHSVVNQGKLV